MFTKILIADRGEIVLRIARTAERMGVATVAVHDEADAGAAHVGACDERIAIGTGAESYRDAAAIVAAAKQSGAQAVHPGCAALRADAAFARAVSEAGLALIGTAAPALERFGDDAQVGELARLAGVRAVPRAAGEQTSFEQALAQARELGYPIELEPGEPAAEPVVADGEDELPAAFEQALARARAAGRAGVRLERWFDRPRLLAVVVMADARDPLALGEVEQSLALDGRVLLEESPAPALRPPRGAQRQSTLRDAAIRIAREGGLTGAGTAKFVLDLEGRLHFSRLEPGLPAEHGLIEMCAGLDLVELQLRIAASEQLSDEVRRAQPGGHAVQARICAEDPSGEPVEITGLRWPTVAPGCLRVETELAQGSRVAAEHGALMAKVIAFGATRHQAALTLDRVLAEATIEPIKTNLDFIRSILGNEAFRAGQYDTAFAARLRGELRTRS
jgi:3-methylcrotonyl-CoA carboxylase alpha subunit